MCNYFREHRIVAWRGRCVMVHNFRRDVAPDALSGCDRRTCRHYARGEAREGYAQVSFLGAVGLLHWNVALDRARKDTAR